jgi:tRNA G18 (ribose-2'-O)-methylase SpoU
MDETVAIPHSPRVESLNAGVAGSIVLYEAARQRRNQGMESE